MSCEVASFYENEDSKLNFKRACEMMYGKKQSGILKNGFTSPFSLYNVKQLNFSLFFIEEMVHINQVKLWLG